MLDLINDTFKLTIDKIYFGRKLSPEEIETETEYELLCTSDQSINKRSNYGLEEISPQISEPPTQNDDTVDESTVPTATESPAQPQQKSKPKFEGPNFTQLFPRGFYPSEEIHNQLLQDQHDQHEKHKKERNDANLKQLREIKMRTAKYSQANQMTY
jgi:hypothetical protein